MILKSHKNKKPKRNVQITYVLENKIGMLIEEKKQKKSPFDFYSDYEIGPVS